MTYGDLFSATPADFPRGGIDGAQSAQIGGVTYTAAAKGSIITIATDTNANDGSSTGAFSTSKYPGAQALRFTYGCRDDSDQGASAGLQVLGDDQPLLDQTLAMTQAVAAAQVTVPLDGHKVIKFVSSQVSGQCYIAVVNPTILRHKAGGRGS